MTNRRLSGRVLVLAMTIGSLTACSLAEAEPNGSEFAAQSCSKDRLAISPTSQIIDTGISEFLFGGQDDRADFEARFKETRERSVLSARAAATNKYWQPLADAWALEEAFARAAIASLDSDKIADDAGLLRIDTRKYDDFVANVNLEFAAVTRDTYCRVAFVKQNLAIAYQD